MLLPISAWASTTMPSTSTGSSPTKDSSVEQPWVLLHHPWGYLAEFDGHEAHSTIHQHCDLLLRGHLHSLQSERVVPPDPSRACLELAAGCVYENSRYPNAFQWIELHPWPRRIKVLYRAWIHGSWNVDRNQPGCPEGEVDFDLAAANPLPKPVPKFESELDQSLISYHKEKYSKPDKFKLVYHLPLPVADFVGREKEIKRLTDSIRKNSFATISGISGISGMAGIGKTQLGLFVANSLSNEYRSNLFIDLRGADEIPMSPKKALTQLILDFDYKALESYNNLIIDGMKLSSGKLSKDVNKPLEEMYRVEDLRKIYLSILRNENVLIMLDNAADANQLLPLLPPQGCALLVTSRTKLTLPGVTRLLLDDCLPPKEAQKLLEGIKPDISPEIGEQLCFLCGYLPLALRAAGSLLAVTIDLEPADYLELLRDERTRLENIGTEGVDVGIEASFNLSYERLSQDTARVFQFLAVFDNWFDAQEEEFICQDMGHKQLSVLLRHSLVLYDSTRKRYRLHDLIRLFAHKRLICNEGKNFVIARYQHMLIKVKERGEDQFDMVPGDYVRDEDLTSSPSAPSLPSVSPSPRRF